MMQLKSTSSNSSSKLLVLVCTRAKFARFRTAYVVHQNKKEHGLFHDDELHQ